MKYLSVKIILILALISVAYGGAALFNFVVTPEGETVKVEWQTGTESDINHFSILRRTPSTSFVEIATVQPKGSNSTYDYTDQSVYKTNTSFFIYKLKIVDNDNSSSYSVERSASPNISGVKRTWGSIKAMFR
jgi:hypothetical protein